MSSLARGVYHYSRDGQPQPVSEPWELRRADSGQLVLRGERLWKDRRLFQIEAQYEGSRCTALQLDWHSALQRRALYQAQAQSLAWRLDDEPWQSLPLPSGSRLFPLLRAATGVLLPQLAQSPRCVVLPCIRDPAAATEFLRPLLSPRHAQHQSANAQGPHYRYYGGEYGETGADYWVCPQGLVRRYAWRSPQGEWTAELETLELDSAWKDWS